MVPYTNQDTVYKLIVEQSIFKKYGFHVAVVISLLLHLIAINYLQAQHNPYNKLQKPVQLTVKLVKISSTLPIVQSNHSIVVTQAHAEINKTFAKQTPMQATKKTQTSRHIVSNPVQKYITVPRDTNIGSLPALVEPKAKSSATAYPHVTHLSPASAVASTTAAVSLPAASQIIAPDITPIKIGVSIPASYTHSNLKPEYPIRSRRFNEQGIVTLKVLVTEDGAAGLVEIKNSSGYPLLDESAKSAVMQWRFNPATVNGKPISESYSLTIPFKLEE